jgi:lysozyme
MDTRALAIIGLATMCAYLWTLPAVDENGETDNAADLLDYAAQAQDYIEQMNGGDEMNKVAFLQALRLGEGTADRLGYYRLCGGGECSTLAAHPAALGWGGWRMPAQMAINAGFPDGRAVSTAAGAYQINNPTWRRIAVRLGLVDFSETSQDEAAWALIGEKGAQADVLAGRIESAVSKLGGLWASLPGARGQQRQVSMVAFANEYTNSGGSVA